jgi:hypothetical protein
MKGVTSGYGGSVSWLIREVKKRLKRTVTQPRSIDRTLQQIGERTEKGKPTYQLRQELETRSVDPGGYGIPHNTEVNAEKNRQKSTAEIISEIQKRTRDGKPTYQLRRELRERSVDSSDPNGIVDYEGY